MAKKKELHQVEIKVDTRDTFDVIGDTALDIGVGLLVGAVAGPAVGVAAGGFARRALGAITRAIW